jgi:hypothetical protein
MKTLLLILSLSLIGSSCKKESQPKTETTTPVVPSKMDLLTHRQWIYSEIYINTTAHKQGTLVYKRGANNNVQNRDNTRAFFWRDGTFDEVDGVGTDHTKMNWNFSNSDSTQYNTSWGSGSTDATIIKLDANNFEWYNPTQHMSGVMTSKL